MTSFVANWEMVIPDRASAFSPFFDGLAIAGINFKILVYFTRMIN